MPIDVYLTPDEVRWATRVGQLRYEHAEQMGLKARFDQGTSPEGHIRGAIGELGFAKGLGFDWPAHVDTFRRPGYPDVFPFWEVRWSSNASRNKAAKDDPPHYLVAHVTGYAPDLKIWGFINAGWCQQNIPPTDPGNRGWSAHFFTMYQLTPIEDGFHSTCAWINGYGDRTGWLCLYCGKEGQGDYGRSGGDGALQPGRVG